MKDNQEIEKKFTELQEYFLNKILNEPLTDVKIQKHEQEVYFIMIKIDNEYVFTFLYQDKLNFISQQLSSILFKLSEEHILQLKRIIKQQLAKYVSENIMINFNNKKDDKPNT